GHRNKLKERAQIEVRVGGAVVCLRHLDFLTFSRLSFLDPRNHPQPFRCATTNDKVEARLPLPSVARAFVKCPLCLQYRQLLEKRQNVATLQLTADHQLAASINAVHLKH